jgi:hypothetical protein
VTAVAIMAAMADELEELYEVKLDEFTALRTKLAKAAKQRGDADTRQTDVRRANRRRRHGSSTALRRSAGPVHFSTAIERLGLPVPSSVGGEPAPLEQGAQGGSTLGGAGGSPRYDPGTVRRGRASNTVWMTKPPKPYGLKDSTPMTRRSWPP